MTKITKQQIIQIMGGELMFVASNNLPDKFGTELKINDATLAHLSKICKNITAIVFKTESDEDACLSVCDYLMNIYNSFNEKAQKNFDNAKWVSVAMMKYSTNYYSPIVYKFITPLLDIYIGRKAATH
ncbi:hypothetical protein [Helicobacter ganmani]|uniref:hypothetical protein n=1 Tax=Helicobacter ganmani TaxID=60246 RepID=UPI003A87F62F